MEKTKLDFGRSFEKMKADEKTKRYSLERLKLTNQIVLTKYGMPILFIPEHLAEDFMYILSRSNVADKMFMNKSEDDLKDTTLFNGLPEVDKEIENELNKMS